MSMWALMQQNQKVDSKGNPIAPDSLNVSTHHQESADGSGSPNDINMPDARWMIKTQFATDTTPPSRFMVKKYGSHVTIAFERFHHTPTVEGIYILTDNLGCNITLSDALIPLILKQNVPGCVQLNFSAPVELAANPPNFPPFVTLGSIAITQCGSIIFENLSTFGNQYHWLVQQGNIDTVGALSFSYSV